MRRENISSRRRQFLQFSERLTTPVLSPRVKSCKDSYFVPQWAHWYYFVVQWLHTLFYNTFPSVVYAAHFTVNTIQWIPSGSNTAMDSTQCTVHSGFIVDPTLQLGSRVSSPLIFSQAGLTWHLSNGCQTAAFIAIPEWGIDEEDQTVGFLAELELGIDYDMSSLKEIL